MMVNYADLAGTIEQMGLKGSIVALHSSLRSFGHLQGGPDTLIKAFLDSGSTLVVPTFTYLNEVTVARFIPQNGLGHSAASFTNPGPGYDPDGSDIVKSMGAIPARILEMPGRSRGNHPLNSFAALGPRSEEIIAEQAPLNVYGPYKWLYDYPQSFLLLVGVDLTSTTPIHFAEERAGRNLFRRWGKQGGEAVECSIGSCSQGFNRLKSVVQPIERLAKVGESAWRVYPFRDFIDRVSNAIRTDPEVTRCAYAGCERCEDAIRGGPLL